MARFCPPDINPVPHPPGSSARLFFESPHHLARPEKALEKAGVEFIGTPDKQPGVRLK